jgi:hypothetical protein
MPNSEHSTDIPELEELESRICASGPDPAGHPLSWQGRVGLIGWGLFLTAGFLLAARLEPDPRGYGTHQQLGLTECSLRMLWGIPCPSCGGTTAFALFVRGRWRESAAANLAACLSAFAAAGMIPWSLYSGAIGRAWRIAQPGAAVLWMLGTIGAVALVQWFFVLVWSS